MNRMRRLLVNSSAFVLPALLALPGCATTAAALGSAAAAAMGAIVARVQAGVTAINNAAANLGAKLSVDGRAAIDKVAAAATAIGAVIANGASAVAAATTGSGIAGLFSSAADVLIPLLQLAPGLGAFVSIIQDVKAIAPSIVAFASSIINPTAVSAAPYDGGAARRLGIMA